MPYEIPKDVPYPRPVERAFQFHGDSGLVRLDPRWFQAASRFVVDGFFHILGGVDHLLFLLCLVIPFRRLGALAVIVTSFTVAHSVTLIASAYDMAPSALWFPPLVETLIAASIVYMAIENIVSPGSGGPEGPPLRSPLTRRWVVTFAFGLVHGFGFSFALRDSLQLAGSHVLTSLVSFNVGVELGQLLVLVLAVPVLDALFRRGVPERIGTIVISAFVAHTGWHWMTERGSLLAQYKFEWPVFDLAFLDLLLRWSMLAVGLAGVAWLIFGVLGKRLRPVAPKPSAEAGTHIRKGAFYESRSPLRDSCRICAVPRRVQRASADTAGDGADELGAESLQDRRAVLQDARGTHVGLDERR